MSSPNDFKDPRSTDWFLIGVILFFAAVLMKCIAQYYAVLERSPWVSNS